MELALNLIWLAIAAGSFAGLARWGVRQPHDPSSRRRLKVAGTAVLSLVALLFPIISITDDLCNDVLLVSPSIHQRVAHDSAHHERIVTAVATVVLAAPRHGFELTSGGLVVIDPIAASAGVVVSSLSARAPPLAVC